MCGRFTELYTWSELVELYRLTQPARNLEPRYNIAPTTAIDVVIPRSHGGLELMPMRWGLIPSWWKKTVKEVPSTFNAHAETVAIKAMFRVAFKRTRCVIPASGYFEWTATPSGKQPFYISAANGGVLSLAGLWDGWSDPVSGETVQSCAIIVCTANRFTRTIHDRMPVILAEKDLGLWLSGMAGVERLRPAQENLLRMWPVSRRVNRSDSGDDPSLIEALVTP